jgi:hypothetical protein
MFRRTKMKLKSAVAISALLLLSSTVAMAAGGGNGNGGGGGGNAPGAATAGHTAGGDNVSTPGSTHTGKFHFHHKKKTKPVTAE